MTSSGFRQGIPSVWSRLVSRYPPRISQRAFGSSIRRPNDTIGGRLAGNGLQVTEAGQERISPAVAALVDTNILVYRFDNRFHEKQKIATDILRRGILENSVIV